MKTKKDIKLTNIYIRIHNKQVLFMDDLAYLAKYNPVCFQKTCDSLMNKVPEEQVLVKASEKTVAPRVKRITSAEMARNLFDATAGDELHNERLIEQIMASLKKIESGEFSKVNALQNVDTIQVKNLLGDLFVSSDTQTFFNAAESGSRFNVSV